jgi:hypothetical protein
MRQIIVAVIVCAAALYSSATALAAPPPNDNRADAQTISKLPATVHGTTVDSTRETNEPASRCGPDDGSVWYRVDAAEKGRFIVSLTANGNLDAVVDVFQLQRSQLIPVSCDTTDVHGNSDQSFNVHKGSTYLIRVSQFVSSESNTFSLTVELALPPAEPPGPPLPKRGASGTLDRVLTPSVAFSVHLVEGVTYRFNLASDSCTPLSIYPPHTSSFSDSSPVKKLGCGGYTLFTPGPGGTGRYSLLAKAARKRGGVKFHLSAARASGDDTAPGHFIRNFAHVRGHLDGSGIDVVDLYRFDVTKRSNLSLRLNDDADFDVTLLRDTGHRIDSSTDSIDVRLKPGRYFAVVSAAPGDSGSYRLSRVSRQITSIRVSVNNRGKASVGPGRGVTFNVNVRPGVRGPVTLILERFDPTAGWLFERRFHLRTPGSGKASVGFRPPAVGRYRIRGFFTGTHSASPSQSGFAKLRVAGALTQ